MWREYFSHAQIFAIDVDPDAAVHANDRITVLIGSQSDTRFPDAVLERSGPSDIGLDDGSHLARDQIATLLHLWPSVPRDLSAAGLRDLRLDWSVTGLHQWVVT